MKRLSAGIAQVVLATATGAAVALGATRSQADWEWTRWGMSPTQVIAGSSGRAQAVQGTEGDRVFNMDLGAVGSIDQAGTTFEVRFFFDPATNGLRVVSLKSLGLQNCPNLKASLTAEFGEPRDESDAYAWRFAWDDDKQGDSIVLARIEGSAHVPSQCLLTYRLLSMPRY